MPINLQSGVIHSEHGDCDIRWGLFAKQADCQRYLLFVNGRSEWIEKYHYLPGLLDLPADCGLLTLDHRGQGASGGPRGTVESYQHYVDDLGKVVGQVIGETPYVAMAHSMGGLILSLAVFQGHLRPHSMVLASPFFGLPRGPLPPWFTRQLAKTLYALGLGQRSLGAAGSKVGGFERNRLTQDRARFEAMKNCPYPVPAATIEWVAESVKAIETIHRGDLLRQLSIPTLVMMGSDETVVDRLAVENWVTLAQSLSQAEIRYHEFNGARHELFSEIDAYCLPAASMARHWFADFFDSEK